MDNNAIAFTGLCAEYCALAAGCAGHTPGRFTEAMLRLLPRIYICAADLKADTTIDDNIWIDAALTEEQYNEVREQISVVMGENDTYLEVFEEDMKYSDTPLAASVSENLADIYQVLYDYLNTVRLGTDQVTAQAIATVKESFRDYWSATLCNVLRALNRIWQSEPTTGNDDADSEGLD